MDNNLFGIPSDNPFHIPTDAEIFTLRDEEKKLRREKREKMRTSNRFLNANASRRTDLRKTLAQDDEISDILDIDDPELAGVDQPFKRVYKSSTAAREHKKSISKSAKN